MNAEAVFARAAAIADAVLWEGYVLYPYRRSAAKNRIRFQWGVVGPAEQPDMTTTVLVETGTTERVHVRVRFLHLHRRSDGWDEAVAVERDVTVELTAGQRTVPITVDGGDGAETLAGSLRAACEADGSAMRVTVQIRNEGPDANRRSGALPREEALLHSFIGCHILLAAESDAFVSLLEPPDWAVATARRCGQHRCWPVLIGPEPGRDLMMASPVILYDYPTVAPQSPGDFFDGTEIDEMLSLRVQTLTDEEKAEARATDPRAAAIIDRCESMSEDVMATLHGGATVTAPGGAGGADEPVVDPNPDWSERGPGEVLVAGCLVGAGSKVVLHPRRRADAHDIFLVDRVATVAEVVHDVDGDVHIAVTVDDDPAAELWDWQGRYLYFAPDEVQPVPSTPSNESPQRRAADSGGPVDSADRAAPTTRVLVAGVGNIFASDDGFGSAVVMRLLDRPVPEGVRIVDYGIRGIHLAFDLADGVETLILVDTVPDAGDGPGSVVIIEVEPGSFGRAAFDAHDLDPNSVFRSLRAIGDRVPRTIVVGCQPANIDDGIGLSESVAAAVPIAADKVSELLQQELRGRP